MKINENFILDNLPGVNYDVSKFWPRGLNYPYPKGGAFLLKLVFILLD